MKNFIEALIACIALVWIFMVWLDDEGRTVNETLTQAPMFFCACWTLSTQLGRLSAKWWYGR